MRKKANSYRITLENGYMIIRKEPAKLTKAQKEFLASHGFDWETDRSASHKMDQDAVKDAWIV